MFRTSAYAAMLVLTLAGPASAQPDPNLETRSMAVRTGDLNLGSEAGVAALDRRIRHAVRQVCGVAPSADLRTQLEARRCRETALDSVAQPRVALITAAASYGVGGPVAD